MLSDPKTFSALVTGLIDTPPKAHKSPSPKKAHISRSEGRMSDERLALLLSMGLTDRDLEYMGPKQRAMVEDVLDTHMRKSVAA